MALQFTQIRETCLYSTDLDAMKAFYHSKLGLKIINYTEGSHLFLEAGNSVLLIFNPEESKHKKDIPRHFGAGELHFAFEVEPENYEKARQLVMSQGIEIEHEHHWGKLRSFYFRDPGKNCVEILEGNIWERD